MIFEKLTDNEKNLFNYLRDYYAHGVGHSASLETILAPWEKAKFNYLYDLFGEELIISKKVHYEAPHTTLYHKMCYLVGSHPFISKLRNLTDNADNYSSITNPRYVIFNPDFLIKNALLDDYTFKLNDKILGKFQKGMKMMKVIKKIADELGIDEPYEKTTLFEDFRQKHSQILNNKMLEGELCLSIHPLDYATMSMNNSSWTSCMNWDEGDYRQGTVEMMNSSCVAVAYLKSENDMNFGGLTWNNKKWRELFVIDPHAILGVRPYPYVDDNLEQEVFKIIFDLIEKNGTPGWKQLKFSKPFLAKGVDDGAFDCEEFDKQVEINLDCGVMYNDFYDSRWVSIEKDCPEDYSVPYSGLSECMWCGDTTYCYYDDDNMCNSLCCSDCADLLYCADCGCRLNYGEGYDVDGQTYCSYCYDNHFHYCEHCGKTHHENDCRFNVHWYSSKLKKGVYNNYDTVDICNNCYDSLGGLDVKIAPWSWLSTINIDVWVGDEEKFKDTFGVSIEQIKQDIENKHDFTKYECYS